MKTWDMKLILAFCFLCISAVMWGCKDEDDGSISVTQSSPAEVVSTQPADGSTDVASNTDIRVTFSKAMNFLAATTNKTDTSCDGLFQVSANDFESCVQMTADPSRDSEQKIFILTPAADLEAETTYKIKVLSQFTDSSGTALSADYLSATGFTTESASGGSTTTTQPDTTVPTAPADSKITISNLKGTSLTLSWNKATDNSSAQADLEYLATYSTSNNLDTVANIEANGTAIGSYSADIASLAVTGLNSVTQYYFNIVVKDKAGNQTAYSVNMATTLAAGLLDTSFSTDGVATHHDAAGGNHDDVGKSIAIDSQGKILVAGYSSQTASNMDMAIWRYHPDGTLDTSFSGDNDGFDVQAASAGGTGNDVGNSVVIGTDGKILVAGYSRNATGNDDMTVWRYNSDGTLDNSFQTIGIVWYGNVGDDNGNAIALDANGKILVTGRISNSNSDMAIWRLNTDGSLDSSFSGGTVSHDSAAGGVNIFDYGKAITTDADGKILVAGYSRGATNDYLVVWRYLSDGTLDTSFDDDGFAVYDINYLDSVNGLEAGIAIDSDGKILVTGNIQVGANKDMAIWRFNTDGSLDNTFDNDGLLTHDNAAGGNGDDKGSDIVLDAEDNIIVTGTSASTSIFADLAIWRFTGEGVLDTSFNNTGFFTNDVASDIDMGYGIALDTTGRLLITGVTGSAGVRDMIIWMIR